LSGGYREYVITAEVRLTDIGKNAPHGLPKYLDEIKRRLRSGKCFHRPAFGVREFAADFEYEDDAQSAIERRTQELGVDCRIYNEDLGLMLYDVFSLTDRATGFQWLSESSELSDRWSPRGKAKESPSRYAGVHAAADVVQS
jgi:CRISPR-associated protein Cas5d